MGKQASITVRRPLSDWFLVVPLAILSICAPMSWSAETVAVQWQFDMEGDLRGWVAGGHIRDAAVSGGALTGETSDWDPILLGPVFEIEAEPTQRVEIKMRTVRSGTAELFWTETLEGQYGGFSQEKTIRFETKSGDDFHVHRICPFWHAAGKIVRLRLDPPATGEFAIEWIRIVGEGSQPRTTAKAWQFDSAPLGWRAWQDMSEPAIEAGGLRVTAQGNSPILMSPPMSVPADENPYVSIRMATEQGSSGRVFCVSSTQFGWEEITFPLRSDGRVHSYNVDVGHLDKWRDQIIMLGIQPTDAEGADAAIMSIEIAESPRGPAELEIGYFGPSDGINRVGRPAEVTVSVRNLGGDEAQGVVATLETPEGLRTIGPRRQTIERLTHWLPKTASWRVEASWPQRAPVSVKLEHVNAEPVRSTAVIEFTPAPVVPPTPYIPEPQPVKSPYDIGVFYFPGWPSMSRWLPILDYPMRRPVLGWYDESNPECADWQIKWAVEHGVAFFMVDWYWCQGNRHLDHWLHNAYMKARFRKHLKWSVMWANHNPPNTHSQEDWRNVIQYWIDNYFDMEEYYRIDGRPAVFIWAPAGIRRDVGGSRQAAELYTMSQQMAREAGLPGIYFVAMSSHESSAACRQLRSEGYEAFTSYHGFQLAARRAGSKRFPFADVVETSPQVWREADQRASGLLYMPIVDTGWASQPWHGSKAMAITGRTPELFGRLCQAARSYAEGTRKKIITVGPCNEWGEGSYIEPYAQYGFDDLNQLRASFCPPADWPPDLIPSDVARGPYDLPSVNAKTDWQFDTDGDFEGWTANGFLNATVRDGLLVGQSTAHDPILHGPGVRIEAGSTRNLVIRMRSDTDDHAQLFWSTATSSQSERNSLRLPVIGDGQFHDYEIDLGKSSQWRGLITSLRFDPSGKSGANFAVDYMRFR